MMYLFGSFAVCLLSFVLSTTAQSTEFILLGSTGDLARKYLFKSLSDIVLSRADLRLRIFATARKPHVDLDLLLGQSMPRVDEAFKKVVTYKQLKTVDHYRALCNSFNDETAGVVFYLAIPPFGYVSSVQMISEGCRGLLVAGKIRIIIEKPFGSNFTSARSMLDNIAKHVEDDFIYRIDHYLGKGIVREILNFRKANSEIEALMSRQTVSSVEIGMLEELDCKGRTEFYNEYGVIRDVMQNHMTELLLLSLLDLPGDVSSSASVCAAKAALLRDLAGPGPAGVLLGQYAGYPGEWAAEARVSSPLATRTPTFAAVVLGVHSPRWLGVPLLLVSGKRSGAKASFVRVCFDRRERGAGAQELLFFIGGAAAPEGLILCSRGLPCAPSAALLRAPVPATLVPFLSAPPASYDAFRLRHASAAPYTNLIRDAIAGRREHFVSEPQLLSSWRTWSSVLRTAAELPLNRYRSPDALRFRRTKWRLQWASLADMEAAHSSPPDQPGPSPVVAPAAALASAVAQRIARAAVAAVAARGAFHVALPGGSSALALMAALRDLVPPLDWANAHVWLTDERCVGRASPDANLNALDRHLLRHVAIPLANVHGVPLASDPRRSCADDVAAAYQAEMESLLGPQGRLDFVVLGVGGDGHTASLFPGDEQALGSGALVTLTSARGVPSVRRVSLTFRALRASREIAVLLVGDGKEAAARELMAGWSKVVTFDRVQPAAVLKPFVRVLQRPDATAFIERSLRFNSTSVP